MEKFSLLAALVLVISMAGVSPAASASNDPKEEKAVMAVLETMAKATIAKDVATLEKIYADDLTYSHSSALTQTKAEVLKAITGPNISESMKFSDTTIRIYGGVALIKGICDYRNGAPGKMTDNHLNILWVLVKNPVGWQIVARQTTRYPAP
jgi:ketosteroid isomerase-like protein